jgi:hypothetical protein
MDCGGEPDRPILPVDRIVKDPNYRMYRFCKNVKT